MQRRALITGIWVLSMASLCVGAYLLQDHVQASNQEPERLTEYTRHTRQQVVAMVRVKPYDDIPHVIEMMGPPENQCSVSGLRDMNSFQRKAFGLQWGIDPDGVILPGDIYEAEVTVWFDASGRVASVEH